MTSHGSYGHSTNWSVSTALTPTTRRARIRIQAIARPTLALNRIARALVAHARAEMADGGQFKPKERAG